jgi:hypothetical protein
MALNMRTVSTNVVAQQQHGSRMPVRVPVNAKSVVALRVAPFQVRNNYIAVCYVDGQLGSSAPKESRILVAERRGPSLLVQGASVTAQRGALQGNSVEDPLLDLGGVL